MYVPRERYSLMMSFCVVPASVFGSIRRRSARPMYSDSSHAAVALIVIDVFIWSSGIASNSWSMSSMCEIGTPTLPTSPRASGLSAS